MTRFARAKGSKASNERLPEQATSWNEMKQQLLEKNKEIEESKKRKEIINQRNANYKAFLEKNEEEKNKNSTWADFPGIPKPLERKKKNEVPQKNLMKQTSNKSLKHVKEQSSSEDEEFTLLKNKVDNILNNNVNNVCAIVGANDESDNDAPPEEESAKKEIIERKRKNKVPRKNLMKKISHKSLKHVKEQDSSEDKEFTLLENEVNNTLNKNVNKVTAVVGANDESDSDAPPEEVSAKKEILEPVIKVKKVKKELLKIVLEKERSTPGRTMKGKSNQEEKNKINKKKRKSLEAAESTKSKKIKLTEKNVLGDGQEVSKNNKTKQKKRKNDTGEIKQKQKIIKENLTEQDLKKIEKKKLKRLKQVEKKKKVKAELKKQKEAEMNEQEHKGIEMNEQEQNKIAGSLGKSEATSQINLLKKTNIKNSVSKNQFNKSNNFNKNEKKAKIRDEEKPQRRKPLLPHKMFIHDKEVEIHYVEGFPIKKEDAERLKKLRREMISKGLPRSEINVALKLERRRAERALANLKKKACFHCRKSGHNLSECPELNKDQVAQTAGSGICFKCGSTEHTHFECKVVRGQEYKFAQCFICKEQGHISRQCPDNARGLYPKGGACHVCGDVTHLKRDCPKYQAQQQRQEDSLRIETFGDSNPDVLEENRASIGGISSNKRQNKIIKF